LPGRWRLFQALAAIPDLAAGQPLLKSFLSYAALGRFGAELSPAMSLVLVARLTVVSGAAPPRETRRLGQQMPNPQRLNL